MSGCIPPSAGLSSSSALVVGSSLVAVVYVISCRATLQLTMSFRLYQVRERESREWAVYYTSLQSFKITISYSLAKQLWGLLMDFDWLVYYKVFYL